VPDRCGEEIADSVRANNRANPPRRQRRSAHRLVAVAGDDDLLAFGSRRKRWITVDYGITVTVYS